VKSYYSITLTSSLKLQRELDNYRRESKAMSLLSEGLPSAISPEKTKVVITEVSGKILPSAERNEAK